MPDEIMIIVVTAIVAGSVLAAMAMLLGFARSRAKDRLPSAKQEGPSLTTSELERIMRQAVEAATTPLAEQIARLEEHLGIQEEDPAGLLEAARLPDFEDALEEIEEPAPEPARRTISR